MDILVEGLVPGGANIADAAGKLQGSVGTGTATQGVNSIGLVPTGDILILFKMSTCADITDTIVAAAISYCSHC